MCAYILLLTSQRCAGMASMSAQHRTKSGQGCQRQHKNFYRYTGDKSKGKENVGPLQRETGYLAIQDMEKAFTES